MDSNHRPPACQAGALTSELRAYILKIQALDERSVYNGNGEPGRRVAGSATGRGATDRLLEGLAGGEAGHAALGDFDGGAGLRVARDARLAAGHLERAEAHERHGVALLQRPRDGVDHRLDGRRGGGLADSGVLGDFGDDVLFVHGRPPEDDGADASVSRSGLEVRLYASACRSVKETHEHLAVVAASNRRALTLGRACVTRLSSRRMRSSALSSTGSPGGGG